MSKDYYYRLSPLEIILANEIAQSRIDTNESLPNKEIRNNKKSFRSNDHITLCGVNGEVAFCGMLWKYDLISFNEYMSMIEFIKTAGPVSAWKGEDNGDVCFKGKNIDIKTSEYSSAHLWITETKRGRILNNGQRARNNIDAYVLLTGDIKSHYYRYRGWLSHDFCMKNWNNTRCGVSGKFSQQELNKSLDFKELNL